ncbi:MAG: PAS domain S-box protein [Acidobacteriota bacterium]
MPADPVSAHDLVAEAVQRLHESFIVTDAELDHPGPRIVFANPAFCRMTGYSIDEIVGQTPRVLQGPATDRRVLDDLRQCLQAGETFEGETFNYRKDGAAFIMRWYIEPIRDADGTITHFFGIQRDVTAEIERRQQQRALEQAVNQLTDSVVLFRRNGRVRYVNDAYLAWSGAAQAVLLERPAWSIIGAPESASELRQARRLLAAGQSWRQTYAIWQRGSSRERHFVNVSVSPIRDHRGALAEYVAVIRDVTERRRLESIAEAHNFQDHLGVVFSGIRHELGNPINSLKAAVQVVSEGLDVLPVAKTRRYLGQIGDELERIEYLLRSLRSYNLYEAPRPEATDVRKFLHQFQLLAQNDCERQGVELTVLIHEDADHMWVDPQALHQVLINLIGNALSALAGHENEHGHEHESEQGRIEISAERLSHHLILNVRDNGPGIPLDHLPHVFKPFYTTHSGGTGLGLAICRRLLSLMRGTLELDSTTLGTEVRITLDRDAPESSLADERLQS